jgi:hypothetical protein
MGCPIFGGGSNVVASDPTEHESMFERIQHPDPNKKSDYQNKTYDAGSGFVSRTVATREYAGVKQYESKSFTTKAFDGVKQSLLGKMLFPDKKISGKFLEANSEAGKQFASKNFPQKEYAGAGRKSSYSGQDSFSTHEFIQKTNSIENNSSLQEELSSGVKQGLTEEEVRKLLNKPL